MAGEFYTTTTVTGVLCLNATELTAALTANGMPAAYTYILDQATSDEPDSVLTDDGAFPAAMVYIEVGGIQTDYALNELPVAVCRAAVGRDANVVRQDMTVGATISPAELIERYLGSGQVKARIYAQVIDLNVVGVVNPSDRINNTGENEILFDGYLYAAAATGTPGHRELLLTFRHFLSDLASSSCVSAQISSASAGNLMFNAGVSPYLASSAQAVKNTKISIGSPYGAAQVAFGSGPAMSIDTWGYWYPPTEFADESYGLQHFLFAVARQDLFAWQNFQGSTPGASACPRVTGQPQFNTLAVSALERIEPFSSLGIDEDEVEEEDEDEVDDDEEDDGDGDDGEDDASSASPDIGAAWGQIGNAVTSLLGAENGNPQFGLAGAITRTQMIDAAGGAYDTVGYRYGLPIPLRKSEVAYGAWSPAYGMGADITKESISTLGPVSMWDKIIEYAGRYGWALAPMSTRAVMMPFYVGLTDPWTTIYASESGDIRLSVETPVDIRGVVLLGRRESPTRVADGANPGDPRAQKYENFIAAYDNCGQGQFVFRDTPAWINAASVMPPAAAGASLTQTTRPAANAPGTIKDATNGITALINQYPAVLAEYAADASALGALTGGIGAAAYAINALNVPPAFRQGLAYAYAKSLYQYERLRHRTLHVSCRYRTDIGPGSTIAVELPRDRFVDADLGITGSTFVYGVVQRVTIHIDNQSSPPTAVTSLQLGFVRRTPELTSDLSGNGHPVWGSRVYGVPLVDSTQVRERLGQLSTLP